MVEENNWIYYLTNYDGLNDSENYSTEKSEDTFRIITLGDSFTFGFNVSTTDNFSELLEKMMAENPICNNYSRFEVLNLGVPGYDIRFGVERFRMRGIKYEPDMVIWYIKDDDFFEPEEEIRAILEKNNFDKTEDIAAPYLTAFNEITEKLGTEKIIEMQTDSMKSFRNIFKKRLIIITHSGRDDVIGRINDFVQNDPDAHLIQLYYNQYQLFTDQHPNEIGHKYIAGSIYDYLVSNGLVECD